MSDSQWIAIAYLAPLLLFWGAWSWRRRRRSARFREIQRAALEAGLVQPASLHPSINPNRCLGCGTCIPACPEQNVLGLIEGKAQVIQPANCIGHGACEKACPVDAITLVIGTEDHGVEVPRLDASFQTNLPGVFVAGELGGMGLIRNAVEQGRQAIESVRRLPRDASLPLDVLIVGAGPAGLAASLAARQHGLSSLTLEQDCLGGAIAHYPRRKLVLTAPVELPGLGTVRLRETTKEALLDLWKDVAARVDFPARYGERVESIRPLGAGFEVHTDRGAVERARAVVLAIGRRGTPRRLGVPGEDLSKVVYRLSDAAEYGGLRVLVVGGGDSAIEAAVSIGEQPGTEVTLAYRGDAFSRAKPANRERIEEARRARRVAVWLRTEVRAIDADSVSIETPEGERRLPNDAVVVCAGGVLPTPFLHAVGIETETKYGTPLR